MATIVSARPVGQPPAFVPPGGNGSRYLRRFPTFAVPALIWYALFTIGPVIAMFVIGLLEWPGMLATPSWTGLGNFATVLADDVFWKAVRTSAVQIVVGLPIMIGCAFLLAFHVVRKPRGHRVLRYLLFIPALISAPAKAMVFYALLAPNGLLNGLLDVIGLNAGNAWLANPTTALPSLIAIDLWSGIGYSAVLIAARLDSVSAEVVEAARMDGAGSWRLAWGIYFPIARDFVGVVAMLQFLSILFSSAQNVLLLTRGGPGTATTTLSYLIYQKAFVEGDLGYSQAVGVALFVLGLIGMFGIRRVLSATH